MNERMAKIAGLLKRRPRVLAALLVLVAAAVWAATGYAAWLAWDLTSGLPDRERLRSIGDMAQSTTIFDVRDQPAFTIFKEQRIEVPLERISPHLIRAVLAVEDQRFYDHSGVDAIRVIGAVLANLREGRRAQGGSTITQQLARQSFLSRDKTLRRKIKEVIVAAQIERTYSKKEILELYLNKVYFGDGLYGVEAASLGYFGKHASDVTLAEAALLAGLVKSPSTYAPTVSVERAVARRNLVLQAMQDSGVISKEEAEAARGASVKLDDRLRRDEPYGQYFKEYVRQALVQQFGWERVYQGGLRVFTTIDMEMQRAAEKALEEALEEIERLRRRRMKQAGEPGEEPPLQGALVAIEVGTGEVRAMVGGRDFKESRFNRAVQARRQPGSAFKPFVYAAALEAGYTPASIIDDLDVPVMTLQGEWTPDDEHAGSGALTLRSALRMSSNRAAVRLLEHVGIDRTVSYAKAMGVGSLPSVPSLALGSGEVTLLSITNAYAAFANKGVLMQPIAIRRVVDSDGSVLYESPGKGTRAVKESTAFLISSMLADVINFGTAWKARHVGFRLPAAGKTGTTNDYHDAWFIGFTPKLAAGVWIGFDQPRTIMPNGYAADIAVPMWGRFMKAATRGHEPQWFQRPPDVVGVDVCRISGKLPGDGCGAVDVVKNDGTIETRSMVYTEYFVRGTQPTDRCPLHRGPSFFDRLAGLFGRDPSEPVPADQVGVPAAAGAPPPPAVDGHRAAAAGDRRDTERAEKEEPKKERKRGFWSRLFGRGDDEDDDREEDRRRDREDRRD
ncbi:MAG TPA: PBP1A family penicillin-binding protein [Vicinamibacterales bacterium]|nr:PBP1A family penicillin-binding protein [Vicinamibacterales bacterium]